MSEPPATMSERRHSGFGGSDASSTSAAERHAPEKIAGA